MLQHLAVLLLAGTLSNLGTPQKASEELRAFDGEWIYVEDRTEGRTLEQMNPPMSSRFVFKVEDGAIVLVWGHGGGGNGDVRVKLDSSPTEIAGATAGTLTRYRASWKEGLLSYEMEFVRGAGK